MFFVSDLPGDGVFVLNRDVAPVYSASSVSLGPKLTLLTSRNIGTATGYLLRCLEEIALEPAGWMEESE